MQAIPTGDYEQVELYFSCSKLKDLDYVGKSDPQVRVFLQTNGQWGLVGQTETLQDNLNPTFKKTVLVDFIFETKQPLRFEVHDIDGPHKSEVIGTVETTVGDIMGARKQTLTLSLHNKSSKMTGTLNVKGDKTGSSRNVVFWQWSGVKLMNTDGWFGKSDPFLRFFKIRDGGDPLQVHETEFIKDNLNPIWKMCQVADDRLCSSNHSRPIRVECWDNSKSGKHNFIGTVDITLDELKGGKKDFVLSNPKKSNPGTLRLLSFSLEIKPSFIDYLRGGEQLNLVTAIDFTGSNGVPSQPNSLHFINPNGTTLNEYQRAIIEVGQIVLAYDTDKAVPVHGFGGKPHFPTLNQPAVSHCFPCSGNPANTSAVGLDGIMQAYMYAIKNVELSGPTYFNPIITEALKVASANLQAEADVYTILLILTDGEIHDMDATIETLVSASRLPMSIIIIGVGGADFTKMEILDGDTGNLKNSRGEKAARDFVQFVPFRKFEHDMSLLARHVLAEVPEQLVQFKALNGLKPRVAMM